MSTARAEKGISRFGSWLIGAIAKAGLTRDAFAGRVGVSKSTVHRWIHGDTPKGKWIEAISDVLLVDFDFVATQAGIRPRELMLEVDPDSPEGQLVPLIRQTRWTDERLAQFKGELMFWIRYDKEHPPE